MASGTKQKTREQIHLLRYSLSLSRMHRDGNGKVSAERKRRQRGDPVAAVSKGEGGLI